MTDYIPECPECGEDMVVRTNRNTGEQFYGCSMYPQCEGTESLVGESRGKTTYPSWASEPER